MNDGRTHLATKIRMTEDRLLRSKNDYEREFIQRDLHELRMQMMRMNWSRNGA